MRLALVAATILLWSCRAAEAPLPPGPEDPAANLARLDAFADRVQREALTATWRASTESDFHGKAKPFGVAPLLMLTDAEVRGLRARLTEPEQTRCLDAIHSEVVRMQSDADWRVAPAVATIARLRLEVPELSRAFTEEADVARRRQLWLAQAPVARKLEPAMREVAAARNAWARRQARSGYLELMQRHRGYDAATAARLESTVRRALQSQALPKSDPWDFERIDPALAARMAARFDETHCLERASFVLELLGFPNNPPALKVAEPRANAFAAFAFYAIDPPADQRLHAKAGAGIVPHWSAFHEYGHAAMSLLVVPGSCRTTRRPLSPAVSESLAKIAERLFYAEEWLRTQHVPEAEIAALRQWEMQSERMRMQSILDDIELERLLYRDPAGASRNGNSGFPAWALKRDLALDPLGRTDYLLARCGQAAVYRRLRQMPGGLLGAPARAFLRQEVFAGATALRFEEWFQRAVGTEPDCTAWLEDVSQIPRARAH